MFAAIKEMELVRRTGAYLNRVLVLNNKYVLQMVHDLDHNSIVNNDVVASFTVLDTYGIAVKDLHLSMFCSVGFYAVVFCYENIWDEPAKSITSSELNKRAGPVRARSPSNMSSSRARARGNTKGVRAKLALFVPVRLVLHLYVCSKSIGRTLNRLVILRFM